MAITFYEAQVNAGVGSTLSDFPVLLTEANLDEGASSAFWTAVDTDGFYIRIATANDGTGRIPMDVIDFDKSAKTMIILTKPSSMTTSTNTIYITLDDSLSSFDSAGDTNGSDNVYTAFRAFFDGAGVDRSGNGHSFTFYNSPTDATGLLGNGKLFNGTTQYAQSDADFNDDDVYTVGIYFQLADPMAGDTYGRLFEVRAAAADGLRVERVGNGTDIQPISGGTPSQFVSSVITYTNALQSLHLATDRVTPKSDFYSDGSLLSNNTTHTRGNATSSIWLSQEYANSTNLKYTYSLIYVYDGYLSADWSAAETSSFLTPATFFVPQGGVTPGGGSSTILPQIMQNYYG